MVHGKSSINLIYLMVFLQICLRRKAEFDIEDDERKDEFDNEEFVELSKDLERFYRKSQDSFDCFLLYL